MDLIDKINKYQLNPPKEDRLIALDDKLEELRKHLLDNKEYIDNLQEKYYIYISRINNSDEIDSEGFPYLIINTESFHNSNFYSDNVYSDFLEELPGINEFAENSYEMVYIKKEELLGNEKYDEHYYKYSNDEKLDFLCNVAFELQKTGKFIIEVNPTLADIPSFEDTVEHVITGFQDALYLNNFITEDLSNEVINIIKESFDYHRIAYVLNIEDYYPEEAFDIFSYGEGREVENISIESAIDSSVIFDSDMLDSLNEY